MAEVNSTLIRPVLTEGFDTALEQYLFSFDTTASTLRPGLVTAGGMVTAELLLILLIHALGTWNLQVSSTLLRSLEGYDLISRVPSYTGEEFMQKYGVDQGLVKEALRLGVHLKAFRLAPVPPQLIAFLKRLHTERDPLSDKELWTNVERDDFKKVVEATMKGADLNGKDEKGRTPLEVAVQGGHEDAALALVTLGADLEARTSPRNATALHFAAERGRLVRLLLEAGASPRAADVRGTTPLHLAAARGDLEAVRLLLEHGAQPDALDVFGESPLHRGAQSGHRGVVEAIHQAGAKPDHKNILGDTPLKRAQEKSEALDFLKKLSA